MATNGQILGLNNRHNALIPGVDIKPYIIAGRDYPLAPWLITPFKASPAMELIENYKMFNTHYTSTRMALESTFGILKARFKEFNNKTK